MAQVQKSSALCQSHTFASKLQEVEPVRQANNGTFFRQKKVEEMISFSIRFELPLSTETPHRNVRGEGPGGEFLTARTISELEDDELEFNKRSLSWSQGLSLFSSSGLV